MPEAPLQVWAERRAAEEIGVAGPLRPDHDLRPGVTVASDLGTWTVLETPGHAPSHVCLHLAERRVVLSGDHLLGRVSLYFDYGWTPDRWGSSSPHWTGWSDWTPGWR